jgi:hypothetical protein
MLFFGLTETPGPVFASPALNTEYITDDVTLNLPLIQSSARAQVEIANRILCREQET